VGDGVVTSGGRLGRPVAIGLAAGHDQVPRDAVAHELDRVIESSLVEGRGPPVVLRGAHDDDRVGRLAVVAAGLVEDARRRIGERKHGPESTDGDQPGQIPAQRP
jgi:hypothetical protein